MRIKRGTTKRKKVKKLLNQTKGFRLSYSKLHKRAKEAVLHAGNYSFQGRRKRQGQFRRLWIERINAALTSEDMKYSAFINNMNQKKVELNRKVLADLALNHSDVFKEVVNFVK